MNFWLKSHCRFMRFCWAIRINLKYRRFKLLDEVIGDNFFVKAKPNNFYKLPLYQFSIFEPQSHEFVQFYLAINFELSEY